MRDKPEEMNGNRVIENIGYHAKERRMLARGSPGPWPRGNQGEFSEKYGFKDMYYLRLSFLFLLAWFACVSVFWGNYGCIGCVLGSLTQLTEKALRTR